MKTVSQHMQVRVALEKIRYFIRTNYVEIETSKLGDWQYCLQTYFKCIGVKKPNKKASLVILQEYNRIGSPIYKGSKLKVRKVKYDKNAYKAYIVSDKWKAFKNRILNERGGKCEHCLIETIRLDLHHKTYARLFNELPEDVVLLCRDCHESVHNKN